VCGIPIKWNEFVNGGFNTRRVLPDIKSFVEGLNKMYDNPDLRKKYGEVGRAKVMRNNSTTNVLPMWTKKFGEILGEN
jgi:glycosyltransferase involved in cell wall biosynthesis